MQCCYTTGLRWNAKVYHTYMKVIANGCRRLNCPHGATGGMPHKHRGSLIIWRT